MAKLPPLKIAITGAGGQIGYSLLFRIASGEMFGSSQPISLHLLELKEVVASLQGTVMELEDCAFPLLQQVVVGSNPFEVFRGVDLALLIGAKPRGPGMERKDLLLENARIFKEQGLALQEVASKDVITLVTGNPCNTNALIVLKSAPKLDCSRIFSMMSLDEMRARQFLAKRAHVPVSSVQQMTVWGNHSSTQVPDFLNATIEGKSAGEVITDRKWLEEEFVSLVQKRGAAVIAARGKSSAASAAHAVIQMVRSLYFPTPAKEWFSLSLLSDGNPYGIEKGLFFSFPCRSKGSAKVEIVPSLVWDDFLRNKIRITEKELIEEREAVASFL